MRYFYVIVAVMCMLSVGIVVAANAEGGGKTSGQGAGIVSQEKEIVTDMNERKSDGKEFGENNEREMPQSQTYDPNTGLPNNVPSDKEGEI